jgi:hypothetical protein
MEIIKELTKNDGIKYLYNELIKSDYEEWRTPGLKAVIQFSLYVFLTVLSTSSNDSGKLFFKFK